MLVGPNFVCIWGTTYLFVVSHDVMNIGDPATSYFFSSIVNSQPKMHSAGFCYNIYALMLLTTRGME